LDTCFHSFCVEVRATLAQQPTTAAAEGQCFVARPVQANIFVLAVTLVSFHSPCRAGVPQS